MFKENIMNNTNFNKVTVIIPTFNRCIHLRRILSYYQLYVPDVKILIADASSNYNQETNGKFISSFSNSNILHLNYPSDIAPLLKYRDAMDHVNTQYIVFCADDDFITPNGIDQSVDFLEKNPDYTVAHGYYIDYEQDKIKRQQFSWFPLYFCPSVTLPDVVERFRTHFLNYYPTFYGVHRTDFMKMIFDETEKHTDDEIFAELLPSMLSAIYGKLKRLDLFYAAREYSGTSGGATTKKIPQFIEEGTYEYKYVRFRDCLKHHLLANSNLTEVQTVKVIDDTMHMYCSISEWRSHKQEEKLKALSIYDKLFLPSEKLKERLRSFLEEPSSKYYDDFDKIRKHVFLHHKYSNTVMDNRVSAC